MNNATYAELAMRTAPVDKPIVVDQQQLCLLLAVIGLNDEAGEVAGIIKKHVFHNHPWTEETRQRLIKELGDVEWYANLLRQLIFTTLEEVHEVNITKLAARYPEGFFSSERSMNRAAGDE